MIDDSQRSETAGERPERIVEQPMVVTDHELETISGPIRYRASAGRLLVGAEDLNDGAYVGYEPRAEVFVTSYVRTDVDDGAARPVVFAFNGGPGSSSTWLHLGLFGPKLANSGDVDDRTPPPYGLRDNPQTLLTDADLVFIDPMSTGFTRAADGRKPADHHGFTNDRDLVGETIRLWLSRNNRWLSPKLLAGESYGTTRAAALAGSLAERHGIAFNGVILISAVLDFGTVVFTSGNDDVHVHHVPTYAAIAHFHGKRAGELRSVIGAAHTFAEGAYRRALAKGARLTAEERQSVAEELAMHVGLDVATVLRHDLRLEHHRYFAELLRKEGLAVGRLDGRVTAPAADCASETNPVDPSYEFIQYPYTAATNHYLRSDLGVLTDAPYEILTDRVQPWSYAEFENQHVTTHDALAAAMRGNPALKVYCAFGLYDGATPLAASEHVLAHLRVPQAAYRGIVRRTYEAGHMMYVHEPSRMRQSADIAEFVAWAIGRGAEPTPDPILGEGSTW